MSKTSHFDFRGSRWSDVAETLMDLRTQANRHSVYAYIRLGSAIQQHMVEKLVRDLDLEDNVFLEDDLLQRQEPTQVGH